MKKLLALFLVIALLLPTTVLAASDSPAIYKSTITVTAEGGRYQIGFINVEFKKDFLKSDVLPATFEVKVYAENGRGYIEFSPSTPNFFKKVHIRVDAYKGLLYDVAKGENIQVDYKKKQVLVDHFSRYCW